MTDTNPKTAAGRRKPALDKIPPAALIHMGVVMGLGAEKYGAFNWRESPISASVYVAAAMRHLLSWADGDTLDEESGASHLAHVMACCAIALDAQEAGAMHDDRPGKGSAARLINQFASLQGSPQREVSAQSTSTWTFKKP